MEKGGRKGLSWARGRDVRGRGEQGKEFEKGLKSICMFVCLFACLSVCVCVTITLGLWYSQPFVYSRLSPTFDSLFVCVCLCMCSTIPIKSCFLFHYFDHLQLHIQNSSLNCFSFLLFCSCLFTFFSSPILMWVLLHYLPSYLLYILLFSLPILFTHLFYSYPFDSVHLSPFHFSQPYQCLSLCVFPSFSLFFFFVPTPFMHIFILLSAC